jgi:hypothetical protein
MGILKAIELVDEEPDLACPAYGTISNYLKNGLIER